MIAIALFGLSFYCLGSDRGLLGFSGECDRGLILLLGKLRG